MIYAKNQLICLKFYFFIEPYLSTHKRKTNFMNYWQVDAANKRSENGNIDTYIFHTCMS